MASGGWGGAYSNPFAAQAAAATAEQEAEKAASNRQQQAFGAWGAGVGSTAPTAPAAPTSSPFNLTAAAAGGANGTVDAREAALQRREAELARREAQLAAAGASGAIKVSQHQQLQHPYHACCGLQLQVGYRMRGSRRQLRQCDGQYRSNVLAITGLPSSISIMAATGGVEDQY